MPEVRAGRIGRPHGLDGSVHVIEAVASLLAEGASVLLDGRPLRIVRRAGTDARPIVRLEGVEDRDSAETLRGRELMAEEAAKELGEDEWWIEDLEGCAVWDGAVEVGVVARVRPMPSCELLEVRRPSGRELLVPLVRDAVRAVDVGAKRIDVDLEFLGENLDAGSAESDDAGSAESPGAGSAVSPGAGTAESPDPSSA